MTATIITTRDGGPLHLKGEITLKGEPPENAADFERETGKFEKYFSEKPGKGS